MTFRRPLAHALLAFLVTQATFPSGVVADIYQRYSTDGIVEFSHRPSGPGWKKVGFPARSRRMSGTGHRAGPQIAPASLRPHIEEAAKRYALPPALLRAVIQVESNFHPRAVSPDGALGLMQLMPFTAKAMGVQDPFDPRQNILGGARYLRIVANRFDGRLQLTLAGYNAGPAAVERHRGVPPYRETRRYVRKVLQAYARFRGSSGDPARSRPPPASAPGFPNKPGLSLKSRTFPRKAGPIPWTAAQQRDNTRTHDG